METDPEEIEAERLEQLQEATERGDDTWSIIVYL